MNEQKTACFSGHRYLNERQIEKATVGLKKFINLAIKDGYTFFRSGMAEGVDLIAADIIIQNRKLNENLLLEAAIPHVGRMKSGNKNFKSILEKCNGIKVMQKSYSWSCFMERNTYMVDNSDLLIAVWDGRKQGGTYKTIVYAKASGKEIKIIKI